MAATPLAEVPDVEAIWRPLESSEKTQANALIIIASQKLRAAAPFDIDARIGLYGALPASPLALDPVVVANVVATIVKRVLVNPDGLASTTQTFGPISEQRTFVGRNQGSDDSRGGIEITAGDLANLLPAAAAATNRARPRSTLVGLSDSMVPPQGFRYGYPGLFPNGWDGHPEPWSGDAL